MFSTTKNLWEKVLSQIKLKIDKRSFETWLKPTYLKDIKGNLFEILVPNKTFAKWISLNYANLLIETLKNLTGRRNIEISFTTELNGNIEIENSYKTNLNKKYTFENFVVGETNKLAYAASLAVANSPSKVYNPLFIYGAAGCGKTHLLHAIGNKILLLYENLNVLYTFTEQFMNELVVSIKCNQLSKFREKFRNIDVLLIDDIQFLAGKERTQEEFFHTFNTLYNNHKQIVISSDRPPGNIPDIKEKLKSRFEWGLVVDLQPPDLKTKIEILKRKAKNIGVKLSDEIIFYIASNIKSSVRELEGCITRIAAHHILTGSEVSLKSVECILKDMIEEKKSKLTLEYIQDKIAKFYNIKVEDLISKKRSIKLVKIRHIAIYLCRKLTNFTLINIGEAFRRDHSTIIHAIKQIETKILTDKNLEKEIKLLKNLILS